MRKETKYFLIDYTDNDLSYIDRLIKDIDKEAKRIIDFFEIKKIENKFNIKLIPTKIEFSKCIRKIIGFNDDEYGIGFVKDDIMYCLSYKDYKSTFYKDYEYEDFIKIIIHEFIHAAHKAKANNMSIRCINEGIACYLSNQYLGKKQMTFDASLDDLLNDKMLNYDNYYILVKYIFENYDKEFINKMLLDKEFARNNIENIYNTYIGGNYERK